MTGVVLIGGKSRRFGVDKVLYEFNGNPLIDHVVNSIKPLFREIILIGHMRAGLDAYRVIPDIRPGLGPLGGIATALKATDDDSFFFCAADMPNLNRTFIRFLIEQLPGHDIVMPVWSRGREPLHAVYHRRILPLIDALLAQNDYRIFSLVKKTDTLFVQEETIRGFGAPESLFFNINTADDLESSFISH
jgi:molybdopterin-guanine dinucleotide biosynthesis protein A